MRKKKDIPAPPLPIAPLARDLVAAPPDPSALLTVAEAQERLGLSPATLVRWVQLRRIRPERVQVQRGKFLGSDFRFRLGDLLDAIEFSQGEPGSGPRSAGLA